MKFYRERTISSSRFEKRNSNLQKCSILSAAQRKTQWNDILRVPHCRTKPFFHDHWFVTFHELKIFAAHFFSLSKNWKQLRIHAANMSGLLKSIRISKWFRLKRWKKNMTNTTSSTTVWTVNDRTNVDVNSMQMGDVHEMHC